MLANLCRQMFLQQPGDSVRGQDGLDRGPVPGVGLEHVLDQLVELIREVFGQGVIGSSTHS